MERCFVSKKKNVLPYSVCNQSTKFFDKVNSSFYHSNKYRPLTTDPFVIQTPLPALLSSNNCSEQQQNRNANNGSYQQKQLQQLPVNAQPKAPSLAEYPANNSTVILTGFRTTDICFVRSSRTGEQKEYKQILAKVNEYGKKAANLKNLPPINSYAIASFSGKFMRVQLLSCNKSKYRILFIDWGHESTRDFEELYEISIECLGLKQYCLPVQLRSVLSRRVTGFDIKIFEKWQDNSYKIVYNNDERSTIVPKGVELFGIQNMESLNEKIQTYINQKGENYNNKECSSDANSMNESGNIEKNLPSLRSVQDAVKPVVSENGIRSGSSTMKQNVDRPVLEPVIANT